VGRGVAWYGVVFARDGLGVTEDPLARIEAWQLIPDPMEKRSS
jgi:hypothetical protein